MTFPETPATADRSAWTGEHAPALDVLIVEDDFVMRRQLLAKLSAGSALTVQVAANLGEAMPQVMQRRFDVILVDLGLPDGSGLRLIEAAVKAQPNAEILVLSALRDEASVVAAISAGAGGYIVKDAPAHDILEAVYNLAAGFSPLSPSIARFLLRSFRREGAMHVAEAESGSVASDPNPAAIMNAHPLGLTAREYAVLLEITRGSSYKQIARTLDITEGTVQTHIKNVYRKLGVSNRSEATFRLNQAQDKS